MDTTRPLPNSLFNLELPFAISDEGTIFFLDANTNACVGFNLAGDYFLPANAKDFNLLPSVQSISADGRIWVGFGMDDVLAFGGMYRPLKWTDGGTPEVLPVPELNFRNEPYVAGVMARGCSADGSVIYGSTWDNLDFGMLYWKDGKVDWAGSDVRRIHTEINRYGEEEICVDAMRCMADLTQISPNGKWIAGAYRYEIMEDGNYHIETYPAVFNTETGKTVIIKDYGERVVSHITNDGIVCIANSSYLPNNGFMYDVNTQTNLGSVQEWILSTYDIIAPMGYIRHVSPDGQYLMAHTMEDSALQPRVVGWYLAPALEK